jgi:hypothetical protein
MLVFYLLVQIQLTLSAALKSSKPDYSRCRSRDGKLIRLELITRNGKWLTMNPDVDIRSFVVCWQQSMADLASRLLCPWMTSSLRVVWPVYITTYSDERGSFTCLLLGIFQDGKIESALAILLLIIMPNSAMKFVWLPVSANGKNSCMQGRSSMQINQLYLRTAG